MNSGEGAGSTMKTESQFAVNKQKTAGMGGACVREKCSHALNINRTKQTLGI